MSLAEITSPRRDLVPPDRQPRKAKCMGTAIFNMATKLVTQYVELGTPDYDDQTHVAITCEGSPDKRTKRWDDADGIRDATAQELADYDAAAKTATADQLYDTNLMLKAFALAYAQREGISANAVRNAIMAQYDNLVS